MPEMETLAVGDLGLDLKNFRTVPQPDELAAIRAMIATSPDRFWGLAESLLRDGYLPTENIIVLLGANGENTVKEGNEPGLDLLEKYLKNGKNITDAEKSLWAGDYPLTVLDEALGKLAARLGFATSAALSGAYPTLNDRDKIEAILRDIGQKNLRFEGLRSKNIDWAAVYGVTALSASATGGGGSVAPSAVNGAGGTGALAPATAPATKPAAAGTSDPKSARRTMRRFTPRGSNREKLEELRKEATKLDLSKTPLAFTFVLRSMFEISAKAYCVDHAADGLKSIKADGTDRQLVDVLRDVTAHLTKNGTDKSMQRSLHGALTELANPEGLLSVTSMNQLVHNPKFSVSPGDVAIRFGNVFPLLEEMNR